MKYITFGLILIWCHVRAIEINENYFAENYFAENYSGKNFKKLLEQLKPILKTGNESLGIPVLDPFIKEQLPVVLNEEQFKLDMLLRDVNITGLSEYDVNDANFKLIDMKINMNISWPLLTTITDYTMKGKFDGLNIYGTGHLDISAHDFFFNTEVSVIINGKRLEVKSIKLKLFLKAIEFRITGFLDDEPISKLISSALSDLLPKLLESEEIIKMLEDFITKKLNIFLITKTIAEMVEIEINRN